MTATILKMRRSSPGRIECSACGAATDAACNCGAPYLAAKERAAAAVVKERTEAAAEGRREKSDRAIAAEAGVSHQTIGRIRLGGVSKSPQTGPCGPHYGDDCLSPSDSDRAIIMIAEHVNNGILLPGPGTLDCLTEAMARASDEHRDAIVKAAHTLSKLAEKA
jgi:hypothetical protein